MSRVLIPPSLERPWHAGMGKRGHVCAYCLNWKPKMSALSLAKQIKKNRKTAITRQQLMAADKFAARTLSFPRTMSIGGMAARPGGWKRNTPTAMLHEKKVIDINATVIAFGNTATPPTPLLLNGCIAGSQNYNRIARKIEMKSLQIRGQIYATTAGTSTADSTCRILVIYDKQSNGAAPIWSDVIKSQNIAGTTSSLINDMINLDNRDRFIVLRDITKIMPFQNPTATQSVIGNASTFEVNEYLKLNMETIFNAGTAGTVGDITTGAVFAFFATDVVNYSVLVSFRTRFVDL